MIFITLTSLSDNKIVVSVEHINFYFLQAESETAVYCDHGQFFVKQTVDEITQKIQEQYI